jgi:transcriptional regulator with PAS, ATPase and Fis domain
VLHEAEEDVRALHRRLLAAVRYNDEVRKVIKGCYEDVWSILQDHRWVATSGSFAAVGCCAAVCCVNVA